MFDIYNKVKKGVKVKRTKEEEDRIIAGFIGGGILGAAVGGIVGAIIGAFVGALIAEMKNKEEREKRGS